MVGECPLLQGDGLLHHARGKLSGSNHRHCRRPAMATIKVLQNGPYLVQGDDVTAVDWNGVAYPIPKRPFALCRCGGSTTKPFCDGTHSKTGFKAAEAAVPGSQDKPATNP
jgi:CDGSH-type Zn-finger protein